MDRPEIRAEAARLLQRLGEHLVLADVVVGHGATRELHRLLEVSTRDHRHRVGHPVVHQLFAARLTQLSLRLHLDVLLDRFADRQLARTLADLGQVGAGEADRRPSEEGQIEVFGDRRLAQIRLEDLVAARLVRQRNVGQLVESARAHDGRVDDVRTAVGRLSHSE